MQQFELKAIVAYLAETLREYLSDDWVAFGLLCFSCFGSSGEFDNMPENIQCVFGTAANIEMLRWKKYYVGLVVPTEMTTTPIRNLSTHPQDRLISDLTWANIIKTSPAIHEEAGATISLFRSYHRDPAKELVKAQQASTQLPNSMAL